MSSVRGYRCLLWRPRLGPFPVSAAERNVPELRDSIRETLFATELEAGMERWKNLQEMWMRNGPFRASNLMR